MPQSLPISVTPATGTQLRCRGWRQEAILRMLENTVHNGERPHELIIYAASGQAARNWPSYHAIVETLKDLHDDETLVVQSGKPVARFRTSTAAPLVLIANTNLVGNYANWDTFFDLRDRGLISYGQYTAGAWQYIGQQGIVQTTYETFTAVANKHFGGSLIGRLVVTAGLGGMGAAQPLAIKMHGAVALVIEFDSEMIEKRIASGYLDCRASDLNEAIKLVESARLGGHGLSVGLVGNAAEILPRILDSGVVPDVVTDQTSAHDMREGYIPSGFSNLTEVAELRRSDPKLYEKRAYETIVNHVKAMVRAKEEGAVVFEYGNAIRLQAAEAGYAHANDFDGFVKAYIRPNFCLGKGPVRWVALSGDPEDIHHIDNAILDRFSDDPTITGWIEVARDKVPHQGLPARSSWFAYGQRLEFGLMVNEMVRSGKVSAPVALTRDHLDAGSVTQPTRETEGMLDGSDAVADWPILNALLNASGGAELVALHQGGGSGMGGSISAGMTLVIDGTDAAEEKLRRVLTTDPGIGVIRHADAGYVEALKVVENSDLMPILLGKQNEEPQL
jgi:urocanate hydratase